MLVRAVAVATLAAALLIAPLINCQTYDPADCRHHKQRAQNARQQRQYNSNNQRLGQAGDSNQQQQHSNILHRSTELEHEEFSLALGSNSGGPSSGQHAHSNYTLLPAAPSSAAGDSPATGSDGGTPNQTQAGAREATLESVANTTPSLPSDSIGSPVAAIQPVVTTSSSVAAPSSAVNQRAAPAEPQNTTGSPVQPNATPEESGSKEARQLQSSNQPQPSATSSTTRQVEETSGRSGGGIFTGLGSEYPSAQANSRSSHMDEASFGGSQMGSNMRHLINNSPQPVSSSPSSISIITPLIGPAPSQQQATHTATVSASIGSASQSDSSSMMKPIFVVGNPLSERDYNAPFQYDASSQQQQVPADSAAPVGQPPKASKSVDGPTHSATHPQQDQHSHSQQQPKQTPSQVSGSPAQGQGHNSPSARIDKSNESGEPASGTELAAPPPLTTTGTGHLNQVGADRMGGPALVYSGGQLSTVGSMEQQQQAGNGTLTNAAPVSLQPPSPRLFQGPSSNAGSAVVGAGNPRRPSLPPPVNQANAASGFRSPLSPSGPLLGGSTTAQSVGASASPLSSLQPPVNSLLVASQSSLPNFYQTSPPYAGSSMGQMSFASVQGSPTPTVVGGYNKPAFVLSQTGGLTEKQQQQQQLSTQNVAQAGLVPTPLPGTALGSGRRPLNITRVEHISAECSNDLIRAVIVFNGTFKGIIYSSGYVSDPTCLYVNGTGSTRYEFSIRLNQCGTLGRQELHQPKIPGEARRRDQVMWNTLSIQYNSIIEQEWDEHYRVSCEYGSDFWKTVSFSPFNVETNTGSPVVFTINPPQCQMDVLLGHGMGPKIAVDGPVTVGDPLTLLIHMKSEKAGYDILVKNCVAHNGGKQRMQLIDSNGCVVNERFISPFRGTYNDNDLRHVTLYAYLKAFRFTGSPVLYLECEIHMCQSACPPQMCYWRRLSKRSVDDFEYEYTTNSSLAKAGDEQPVISDSLNLFKALQVRQEPEPTRAKHQMREVYAEDDEASLVCYRHTEVYIFFTTIASLLALVITIAITCCLRIRKLTRSQFEHNRLAATSSLSPSLLSISDALSSASSLMSGGSFLGVGPNKANLSPQSWHHHQQQHHISGGANLHKQQRSTKPQVYLQRQPASPRTSASSFQQTRNYSCLPQASR